MSKLLMNPETGTVQTEEDWRADFATAEQELWGGPNFEDARLVEVVEASDGYREV
jgi:hypothetical protein